MDGVLLAYDEFDGSGSLAGRNLAVGGTWQGGRYGGTEHYPLSGIPVSSGGFILPADYSSAPGTMPYQELWADGVTIPAGVALDIEVRFSFLLFANTATIALELVSASPNFDEFAGIFIRVDPGAAELSGATHFVASASTTGNFGTLTKVGAHDVLSHRLRIQVNAARTNFRFSIDDQVFRQVATSSPISLESFVLQIDNGVTPEPTENRLRIESLKFQYFEIAATSAVPQILMPNELPAFRRAPHEIELLAPFADLKPAQGSSLRRRTVTRPIRIADVELELTQAQAAIWHDWYENVLRAGALPFVAKVAKIGTGVEYWPANILEAEYEPIEALYWIVKLKLRLYGSGSATPPPLSGFEDVSIGVLVGLAAAVNGKIFADVSEGLLLGTVVRPYSDESVGLLEGSVSGTTFLLLESGETFITEGGTGALIPE